MASCASRRRLQTRRENSQNMYLQLTPWEGWNWHHQLNPVAWLYRLDVIAFLTLTASTHHVPPLKLQQSFLNFGHQLRRLFVPAWKLLSSSRFFSGVWDHVSRFYNSRKLHFASQVGKISSRTTGIRARDLFCGNWEKYYRNWKRYYRKFRLRKKIVHFTIFDFSRRFN